MPMMDDTWNKRRQYLAYACLSIAVVGLTAIVAQSSSTYYQRFYGGADSVLVAIGASLVGAVALRVLMARGGFEIVRGRATLRGMAVSAGLATLMGVAIIIADLFIRYPENLNVPVPEALLFYPTIGFVAEIVFHVLPLTILMLVLSPLHRRLGADRLVWLCIVIVAVSEPVFQVAFEPDPFSWPAAYTGVHVFVFALLQLAVFRRYDFASMYSFRLFYYVYWHIVWGVIRLDVLF
jgi:hypothetical protein